MKLLWTDAALLPPTFVIFLCLSSLPIPVPAVLKSPFQSFLNLHEAEALEISADGSKEFTNHDIPLWRTTVFAFVGLLEALGWLSYGYINYYSRIHTDFFGTAISPFLIAASWVYTVVRPVVRPTVTPPYDLFAVYCAHFATGVLFLGGVLFDHGVVGSTPLLVTLALSANLGVVVGLLVVLGNMPLAVPSNRVKKEDIGYSVTPEDYTTLWSWITFSWVYPLVQRGRYNTLNETDIWSLSPSMQSRPLFIKFATIKCSTLLRRILVANSLDLILDVFLTYISIMLSYAGPFFLKCILEAIDLKSPTPANKAKAYIYAFLAFVCSLLRAEADVQHLWFGRRACTRVRSELMASIYDKALKRMDFSGIVDKEKDKVGEKVEDGWVGKSKADVERKRKEKRKEKADDPKSGADVGKIVNLMAGDASKISQMVSGAYFIYGTPFELAIAGTFLFQLLGWSAFAGFVVLIAGWPLNNLVARRSVRTQKGLLAARDKRMGVLNELIGAVKVIKFFAWEEHWIRRVLDAREHEMEWMVKARVNSVMLYLLWTCAPILVSIISFFAYVMQGKELTVSVAFTAIALFNMIRAPLNVFPTWIVNVLQTSVALNRVAVYLDEDEVSPQVSSLKNNDLSFPTSPGFTLDDGLGLENASFKWNEVEEKPKDKDSIKNSASPSTLSSNDEVDTAGRDVDSMLLAESGDHRFELRDINVRFPEGQLSLITGPTASGKTALLMALLGEMTMLPGGRIIMSKTPSRVDEFGHMHAISYSAQLPWLQHQSIKENILFGHLLDEKRYEAVIEACALLPDLGLLEDGDATEIGARGVSLSGGQKARVALARAVYARTRYVLLDDPLSAVDSDTSRFLFERLLRGPLLANRTVILVTHHVELVLPSAHYLVRMLDGRIDAQGTVNDLRARGVLEDITHDAAVEVHKEVEGGVPNVEEGEEKNVKDAKKPRKLIKDEHRETGGVKWLIYRSYLKASSYWIWSILGFLVVVAQVLGVTEKLWIMTWGEAYKQNNTVSNLYNFRSFVAYEHEIPVDGYLPSHQHLNSLQAIFTMSKNNTFGLDLPNAIEHPMFYIGMYAIIGFAIALVGVVSVVAQYTGALRASRILFKQLLVTVVRATFWFHDTTPQGRMLNRFGKDIEAIDTSLASSLQTVNSSLATFFASIITVAVVFPWFLLPACIIGFAYRELAMGYLNTGRDLRRMESNTRSPIFSDFGELLEGIVTVRAFSAEKRFLDNLHRKIDTTTKMWYTYWMTNRWLMLNFDALSALAVLVTSLFSIATLADGAAGFAGLCITSAMAFTVSIYWACRFWTALALDLNSVERVVEYFDLPQEPPTIINSNRVPASWPSSSNNDSLIIVEDLAIKYAADLPVVLQNISFSLKAGERVGLLGRTGSGKSTLAMSILRFVDPTRGRILIDGIDISTIGIHDLRSRLTFIPQDATLFSGTLRDNLDPFNEHEDSECLDVLYRVQMMSPSTSTSLGGSRDQSAAASHVASRAISIHEREDTADSSTTPTTEIVSKTTVSLDTKVSAGGTNFSQGQRQLIAMARALLRRSSIIVLDEATSSIDFATDAKIQATIREEFNNSLLLTVAHRLHTVIDYDRLIVLDKGQIAEFDTPWNLIRKDDGIFRNMCLKSGYFGELEATAQSKAEQR